MAKMLKSIGWWSSVLGLALSVVVLPTLAAAQDDQDDPPTRVARLGYMEGSVSFQPAGEDDWVQAVPNRPMTTGDKLWSDKDSRVELQLGSAVIRLNENTGFSFLNLDDNTIQIQLTAGSINVRVRRLDDNDDLEVDTPNLAFTASEPGSYRIEASDDGTYTEVAIRNGGGQATGNGQTYTVHAGQQATFSGTDSLNADVVDIGAPDPFDTWAHNRDHRYDVSPSAHYLAADVVGFEDLDDHGDWRDDSNYGHVWFPNGVQAGWAPYHTGHWDWIEPWGYTWVDDSPWGYAPFHYGRWVTIDGRWGWVAGPVEVRAVYAPALVVFIGGGPGVGFGGNVGWFPLGPREVYVPPYQVSRGYMTQINVSNTTVNTTVVTNVYNTTIINKTTNITNVTYVNRSVQGAVMVVPQHAFASAQPVASVAVRVNAAQLASVPVSARVAVAPTQQAVLGARASTAGHVAAPPAAVMNRQVIAKKTPPPAPVPFAKQQQALAAHPGQAPAKAEMQTLRPAASAASHPAVKVAPPGRAATPTAGRPGSQPGNQQPGNQQNAARPGQPAPNAPTGAPQNQPAQNARPGAANPAPANRPPTEPSNRPEVNQPANRPAATQPPRTQPNQTAPANRPETNRPVAPATQPQANRPQTAEPPARTDRPAAAQPNTRPESRPEASRPEQPAPRQTPPAAEREQHTPPPAANRPAPAAQRPPAKPQTPAEKKKQEEDDKKKPPQ
jgi:hypothetical protein